MHTLILLRSLRNSLINLINLCVEYYTNSKWIELYVCDIIAPGRYVGTATEWQKTESVVMRSQQESWGANRSEEEFPRGNMTHTLASIPDNSGTSGTTKQVHLLAQLWWRIAVLWETWQEWHRIIHRGNLSNVCRDGCLCAGLIITHPFIVSHSLHFLDNLTDSAACKGSSILL